MRWRGSGFEGAAPVGPIPRLDEGSQCRVAFNDAQKAKNTSGPRHFLPLNGGSGTAVALSRRSLLPTRPVDMFACISLAGLAAALERRARPVACRAPGQDAGAGAGRGARPTR